MDDHFSLRDHAERFMGIYSDYYPFPAKVLNKQLLCTGIDTRQPYFFVDGNRFVIQMDLEKNIVNMDMHCDSWAVSNQTDPRFLFRDLAPQLAHENKTKKLEDPLGHLFHHLYIKKRPPIYYRIYEYGPLDHYKLIRNFPPYFVHYVTSYSYMKHYCKARYANQTGNFGEEMFYDNCATAAIDQDDSNLEVGEDAFRDYSRSPNNLNSI